jgi:hypothetical protein
MRPLFSILAGESLVGNEIERRFPEATLWLPAKDTGVDLLVTNAAKSRFVTLQVKYSRTYSNPRLNAITWFKLKRTKLLRTDADLWILILWSPLTPTGRQHHYVILPPRTLLKRLTAIHGREGDLINTYFAVAPDGRCWETRGVRAEDERAIVEGRFQNPLREFATNLDEKAWPQLKSRLRIRRPRVRPGKESA